MPAGTIALTNGSTAVTGTGTSFTSELKAGDFVYVTVGGAPYTLVASAIGSDTQFTLAVAFDGPTTSGLAWNSVPASLQVAITQKILNDFASVARGRILDFQNWQKIYSSDASVTVTRPDRTQFTGPSWGYMAAQFANKADKSALGDAAGKNTGTAAGTVAAGDDSRITGALQKSGGTMTGGITMGGSAGIDLSGSNLSNINVMSWISTAAARASLAAAGFSQPSSTVFDLPGASRTMRVICATAVVTLNSGSTGTITYPNAFPNACNAVVACNGDRNTTGGNVNIIGTSALGGFNFICENSASSGVRINYIAVGY